MKKEKQEFALDDTGLNILSVGGGKPAYTDRILFHVANKQWIKNVGVPMYTLGDPLTTSNHANQ